MPIDDNRSHEPPRALFRFSLRTLLLVTTGIAITAAVLAKFPSAGGPLVAAGLIAYGIRFWRRHPEHQLAATALVGCMFLPYAWVVGYDEFDSIWAWVASTLPALPTLFPAMWGTVLFGQDFHQAHWLAYVLTVLEFALGLWLVERGSKRTIAYLLLVLLTSAMGSLVFYQLCRA